VGKYDRPSKIKVTISKIAAEISKVSKTTNSRNS
jgi:hypothetical protein